MTDPMNDPRFLQDPYPAYTAIRSTCPVQPVPGPDGHIGYLVTGYTEAREALGDGRRAASATGMIAAPPQPRRAGSG
ncbi:hypothetical protein ACWC9X_15955 [Streptomyces asoensis]